MGNDRKEVPREQLRPDPTFTRKPTGHVIPVLHGIGPSSCDEDPFKVPDCGVKAGGQFSDPFFMDDDDLPTPPDTYKRNRQGF
jgi:hypothetical protein